MGLRGCVTRRTSPLAPALFSTCESSRLVGFRTLQTLAPRTSAVAMKPGAGRVWVRGSGTGAGRESGCQTRIRGAGPWLGGRGSETRVRSRVGRILDPVWCRIDSCFRLSFGFLFWRFVIGLGDHELQSRVLGLGWGWGPELDFVSVKLLLGVLDIGPCAEVEGTDSETGSRPLGSWIFGRGLWCLSWFRGEESRSWIWGYPRLRSLLPPLPPSPWPPSLAFWRESESMRIPCSIVCGHLWHSFPLCSPERGGFLRMEWRSWT